MFASRDDPAPASVRKARRHFGSTRFRRKESRRALAFKAKDRAAVDRFHKHGVKAGGKDNGAPGLRADYSPTYYAAFLIDPDGNNVEAVCMD